MLYVAQDTSKRYFIQLFLSVSGYPTKGESGSCEVSGFVVIHAQVFYFDIVGTML